MRRMHMTNTDRKLPRREFLARTLATGAMLGTNLGSRGSGRAAENKPELMAGEGVVDMTPPLGIELGGFHRPPGQERRITGIRQPTAARALVLQRGDTRVAVLSLDIAALPLDLVQRVQQQVAAQTGILADQVRVCATHTHSMPSFCYLRQWGAVPREFMASVEAKAVEAVKLAHTDLAPAALYLGKSRAVGGSHNRTTKSFKTDDQFGADSTDDERWLDTLLHVLYFERAGEKRNLVWYHFSAHPVCFADEQAGPDWPGMVDQRLRQSSGLGTSYLQGHAGDVNPGCGDPWRGDPEQTTQAVYAALQAAISGMVRIDVETLRSRTASCNVPLDIERFKSWLAEYRDDPAKCTTGNWVDAGFAKDWYEGNVHRDLSQTTLPISLGALQIGCVGLVFHPTELYSYYGLAIRRASPLPHTIAVGYADGVIGYLADPRAYEASEYAAIVVPKILDFPPFTVTAAREMAAELSALLGRTVA